MSVRCSDVRIRALALPPLSPPLRPRTEAALFFGDIVSSASPVAISTISFASWFGSRGRLPMCRVCPDCQTGASHRKLKQRHLPGKELVCSTGIAPDGAGQTTSGTPTICSTSQTSTSGAAPTRADTTAAVPLGCTGGSRLRRTGSRGSTYDVRGVPRCPRNGGRCRPSRALVYAVSPYIKVAVQRRAQPSVKLMFNAHQN